jgi:glycosyltransferase involved in cell wall biosynthesis
MENKILISIVTPSYNSEKFISQTIESVVFQTYQNWEMIIVDDCSTDESFTIAKLYSVGDARIKLFQMNKNSGTAACRNKAIELSNGQYLAFLDSDDLWFPQKLEKQLRFMQEHDCDFSFTEYEHIDEDGKKIGRKSKVIKKLTYKKMLLHCFTGCLTVMYIQDINNKIYGPYLKNTEDWALFLEVLKHKKKAFGYFECLAKYRIRHNSLSRNKLRKLHSYFQMMTIYEHENIFLVCIFLLIHQIIKIVWKYKKID